MNPLNNLKILILLTLVLGFAPFFPEPHLWGKIKWIWGGADGMTAMDWFDFAFHSLPFFLLIRLIVMKYLINRDK